MKKSFIECLGVWSGFLSASEFHQATIVAAHHSGDWLSVRVSHRGQVEGGASARMVTKEEAARVCTEINEKQGRPLAEVGHLKVELADQA